MMGNRETTHVFLAFSLWCSLALPPVAAAMESRLLTHVLLQLPALVLCGYLLGIALRSRAERLSFGWNRGGFTGIAVLLPTAAIWMLPRSIDASLETAWLEAAKFVTVPLLVGLPLALSAPRLGALTAGFLKAQFVSMALFLGWIFSVSPVRLCNSYLIDDQALVGATWLVIAGIAATGWAIPLFFDSRHPADDGANAPATPRESPYTLLRHDA